MENIIKGFLGMFFIVLTAAVGLGLISASIDSAAAERALDKYCARIENSHFSDDVISACCIEASADGRELVIETSSRLGENVISYGEAELRYTFNIPILGIEKDMSVKSPLR
ncbi:MAG: hypothetical protein K6F00_06190 [Lachnospiraceae bacterium]|nr:hypothetical protein [Lachnospiraceae bacterium]